MSMFTRMLDDESRDGMQRGMLRAAKICRDLAATFNVESGRWEAAALRRAADRIDAEVASDAKRHAEEDL